MAYLYYSNFNRFFDDYIMFLYERWCKTLILHVLLCFVDITWDFLEILCFITNDCKEKEIEAISSCFVLRLKITKLSCILAFWVHKRLKPMKRNVFDCLFVVFHLNRFQWILGFSYDIWWKTIIFRVLLGFVAIFCVFAWNIFYST